VRILLDQGTPVPLRAILAGHEVSTAYELGWSPTRIYATSRTWLGRRLSILVLPTTNWAQIREHADAIQRETISLAPGDYRELTW